MFDAASSDRVTAALRGLRRVNAVLVALAAVMLTVLVVCAIAAAPFSAWNDARLAPVAAWLRGLPLYTPEGRGVILGNYYPPLGGLAFLPAALFGHPVPALLAGSALAWAMNMSAGVGALFVALRGARGRLCRVLCGSLLYLALMMAVPGPNFALFAIHVDAPALALMLWGVIAYAAWWTSRRRAPLIASAVLLASVVWTKQVGVALPVVYCALTLVLAGLRPAVLFAGCALATTIFWPLVLTPVVKDWQAFFFAIWSVHAGHPWRGEVAGGALEHLRLFLATGTTFLRQYWPFFIVSVVATAGLGAAARTLRTPHVAFALCASALIAAVTMLPLAWLGLVKAGGNVNASAYAIQPLLLAIAVAAVTLLARAREAAPEWALAAQAAVAATLVTFLFMLRPGAEILSAPFLLGEAPVVTAFDEAKRGNVWFPEFPLSTLLATGRAYHHGYSVSALYLGHRSVTPQQFAEGLPPAPFVIKYRTVDPEGGDANKLTGFMRLTPEDVSERQVGAWTEVAVKKFPP